MKLIHDDCLSALKTIPTKSIECCITSPPYNIGVKYNSYQDKRTDYRTFLSEVFTEIERILTDDGHFFLNIAPTRKDPFLPYTVAQLVPMKVQNPIVWNKAIEIENKIRGQAHSLGSERFLPRGWEMVWHFTKNGKQPVSLRIPYSPEWAEYNFKKTGRKDRSTTDSWFIPYETTGSWGKSSATIKGEKKHPATFPIGLVEHCLKMCSPKSVIDPFAGTGTVGVVAEQMDIAYILIEIDNDYFDFITKRLEF